MPVAEVLEFWPDYGQGPLWDDRGRAVDLDGLGLPSALVERIRVWHSRYDERRLPIDGPGDPAWLREGQDLLASIRGFLIGTRVVVTEPWWEAEDGTAAMPPGGSAREY